MLIATHADVMPGGLQGEELAWQSALMTKIIDELSVSLADKYPYMAPLVLGGSKRPGAGPGGWSVSTTKGDGMKALKKGLIKTAVSLPTYGELLPRNWLRVREQITKESRRARQVVMGREEAGYSVGGRGMAAAERDGSLKRKGGKAQGDKERSEGGGGRGKGGGAGGGGGAGEEEDVGGTSVGFMWIGHFKRLVKECGVDDSQCIPLLRFFHDAGPRCPQRDMESFAKSR